MPSDELTMLEIMKRWPGTVRVIRQLDLYCVGCPFADFHTPREAAEMHGIDLDDLLAAIERGKAAVYSSGRRPEASGGADREP